ncbi:MAG: Rrf2 family transcriptional regulator [Clostridia bacterium]|nr:Rrf2 family transcriptional regulator [Clostridia bacterium]
MKLSTRGRYGIHAMFDLAVNYDKGARPIKSIAESRGIPEAYLEQLFSALRKDNLVISTRGAQGGYVLSRSPKEITVGDVLRTLEGGLNLVDCLQEDDLCGKACDCPSRTIWKRLTDGVNHILDGITLQDMIDENQCRTAQEE